jgi:hypothetical protein
LLEAADCFVSGDGDCQERRTACTQELTTSFDVNCGDQLEGMNVVDAAER